MLRKIVFELTMCGTVRRCALLFSNSHTVFSIPTNGESLPFIAIDLKILFTYTMAGAEIAVFTSSPCLGFVWLKVSNCSASSCLPKETYGHSRKGSVALDHAPVPGYKIIPETPLGVL